MSGPDEAADPAGRVLARLSTWPALVLAGYLAVAFVLVLGGGFTPLPAFGLAAVVAALLLVWVRRPARLHRTGTPWWVVWSVLGVAVAFGVLECLTHSEQILVERDPAAYVQFGWWLAEHGGLPVDQHREAFGGGVPGLSWNSPAFYQVGTAIWPQFMVGLPTVLAAASWVGGVGGMLVTNAVVGSLSVLAFGGLVARLVGPRWAPFGAFLLAFCYPHLFVAKSAYSEPLAQLLVVSALCLLVDCRVLRRSAAWAAAGAAGLLLGIGELVRIDVLRDLIPAVALVGVFAARRRAYALPFGALLAVGFGLGALDGVLLSRPYVDALRGSLVPLLAVAGVVVVAAVAYGVLGRRGRLGPLTPERLRDARFGRLSLPSAAGGLVLLAFVAFATRPLWQTVRGAEGSTRDYIREQQQSQGLPIDPGRWYYEWSLHWVAWWLGWAAVVLAGVAAAVLTARLLRGRASTWLPVLPLLLWSTATTLWMPSITPDHPWADRRLVPVVLPAVVLLACWGLRWCVRRVRERRPGRPARVVAVVGVLALLAPIGYASGPLAWRATHRGEIRELGDLCRAIGPDAAVIGIDRATNVYMQAVRGMCGVPIARFYDAEPARVRAAVAAVERSGRRPVLLGGSPETLAKVTDATPHHVVDLRSTQDQHTLVDRPNHTVRKGLTGWLAFPS